MILVINSAEKIIMMVTINNNAGHPISIRDVRNNISSERVKNSLINSIILISYRYFIYHRNKKALHFGRA